MWKTIVFCVYIACIQMKVFETKPIGESDKNSTTLPTDVRLCPQNINTTENPYRYYNKTGECYRINEEGPCGKVLLFNSVNDTQYGDCFCQKHYDVELIYWPKHDWCYKANERGPCENGECITYDEDERRAFCHAKNCSITPPAHSPTSGLNIPCGPGDLADASDPTKCKAPGNIEDRDE